MAWLQSTKRWPIHGPVGEFGVFSRQNKDLEFPRMGDFDENVLLVKCEFSLLVHGLHSELRQVPLFREPARESAIVLFDLTGRLVWVHANGGI